MKLSNLGIKKIKLNDVDTTYPGQNIYMKNSGNNNAKIKEVTKKKVTPIKLLKT